MKRTPKILFGSKVDWEPMIRSGLEGFNGEVFFGDFHKLDLSQFDIILPLKIEDYGALRDQAEIVSKKCIYPSGHAVNFCDNKLQFNRAIRRTSLRELIPPLLEIADRHAYPFILKKARDAYGANSVIIRSREERVRSRSKLISEEYFAQEYVEGEEEYATHILVKSGQIMFSTTVKYDMDSKIYVKGVRCHEKRMSINYDQVFRDEFVDILNLADFKDGTCCFDYKIIDGKIKMFELNPRFGWSLICDIQRYLSVYADAAS